MQEELIDARVAIAVLETNYTNLSKKVDEVRDEMRSSMKDVGGKLDAIATQLSVQKATGTLRARALGFLSHAATGGATILVAKILHVPLNLG